MSASGEPRAGTLLDSLRVAVVMLDTSGRVQLWSPLAEEVLGWPGEHIVGRRIGGLFGPPAGTPLEAIGLAGSGGEGAGPPDAEAPDEDPSAQTLLAELLRDGRWDGILSLRHRDGHTVQVETRASLLVDGDGRPFVLASLAETSRLNTLEHDLAVLDSLFHSSPLGVAVFDNDLRYVRVNDALVRMNGVPAAGHLGRTVMEVLDPSIAGKVLELQRQVLATGEPVIDLVLTAPDGRFHRSVSYNRLVDRAGRVLGISTTILDVSERVRQAERAERHRRRLDLLNEVGSRVAGLLDVGPVAQAVAEALAPGFGDYAGVVLHRELAGGELPASGYQEGMPLRLAGVAAREWSAPVKRMLRRDQPLAFVRRSAYGDVLAGGRPRLVASEEELPATSYPGDPMVHGALELGVTSLLVLPLRARGVVLGLLVVARARGREPFDHGDLAMAGEVAVRAGIALDNARLYVREREGALMLQRSLLPRTTPEPPGVAVAIRYLPASSAAEVGGDWYDVIPQSGGRLALVVGDVMGHGLPAAAAMGRLRTAVRTLAALDLPPDELLRRVNELGDDLAPGPGEIWMATAVYAVYDPSTRRCSVALAGHLPPVLVVDGPGGVGASARVLDLPAGLPLGVGRERFETTELDVPDGGVLVLYTDGLVEARGSDIDAGIGRLRAALSGRRLDSLEDACDGLLAVLDPDREADDVALLMARLGAPDGSAVSWSFPAEASAVRLARRRVRDRLAAWELRPLTDVTELLVSELVTNSLRYARGPIGVRMVRGDSLLVEVSDPLPDPPRVRDAAEDDEGGRGLQLVARTSRRWGTRRGALGKTVWFELALP
ncbi:SpoIIE family protein phosphatase [Actinacidiphila yeochonensis]|uniref:SpoIIE family protein phosphatase n=1 Tax=Actinacidiphila yeochonensis TaxID=89050 RepID=UPI00056272A4|nr:SpoIIE family protein phosphatase [Actinacidiphila yeochonensis]